MKRFCTLVIVAVAGLLAAGRAEAGLIPTNVSIMPDGANFRWTYAVVVTTDVMVNPGDYFTIFDFGGLVGAGGPVSPADVSTISAPPGWTVGTQIIGPTPNGTNPADDAGIVNMSFTYSGADPINGQQGLGNFSAISTFGESTTSDFTSITHRQVDGRTEANITTTDVPVPGAMHNTPEPATLGMFGLGLPVLGMLRFLRRRKKA